MQRNRVLIIATFGLSIIVAWGIDGHHLRLPVSASAPRGLYLVGPSVTFSSGDIVEVTPPRHWQEWRQRLGAATAHLSVLKPIAALAGDTVCVGEHVSINGVVIPNSQRMSQEDTEGLLPHWLPGCEIMGPDQVFLLSTSHPRSLDSRYMGPVTREDIIGIAIKLIGW